jgi:hypothetical protein
MPVSLFGMLLFTTSQQRFTSVGHILQPQLPTATRLAVATAPHGLVARLSGGGYSVPSASHPRVTPNARLGRVPVAEHRISISLINTRATSCRTSGSRVALPPPRPLRTRRASFPAPGSSLGKAPRSTRRADNARLHDLELPAAGGAVNLRHFWFKFPPRPVGLQCGQRHALSKVTAPVEPVRLCFVIQDPSEVCPLSGWGKV